MTQIDYKAEVLKVYPDAEIRPTTSKIWMGNWWVDKIDGYFVFISIQWVPRAKTEIEAWRKAYKYLKQKGRI